MLDNVLVFAPSFPILFGTVEQREQSLEGLQHYIRLHGGK